MGDHGLDTQLLECFLQKHFHDRKMIKVTSVEVKNAVPQGDNYASMVYRVKMNCLTASGRKKCFSLITKKEIKIMEAMKEICPVFQVEIRMYTTILPLMEDLMYEFNDKRDKIWPELLGFQPYNFIAFNDLTDEGFVGASRRDYLDFNHAKLVLRSLARFHAMSKVLLTRNLISSDEKGKFMFANQDPMLEKWWDVMITTLSNAMVNNWGEEWTEIAGKLVKVKNQITTKLGELSATWDKRFEVMNHGDPWTCNTLFKYLEDEENIPIAVKLVDYQLSHVNSFIWDVNYFISTSVVPNVRRARLDELFVIYRVALEKNLQLYDYSGYIPTVEDMKTEWDRTGFARLVFFLFSSFMSAETTEAINMEKMIDGKKDEIVHSSVFTDGKVMNGLGEDFKVLAEAGYY